MLHSWNVNYNGNVNNNNRNNSNYVRAVCDVEPSASGDVVYDIPFSSVLEAYENCLINKSTSYDALFFKLNVQENLYKLWQDIIYDRYKPSPSKCFVVRHPVYREVFAAAFRDRIVHHWIAIRVNPYYEQRFIEEGNVSKNCRKGEGTKSAVDRLEAIIKEASNNYTEDCIICKGDIQGFFMSIDKSIMWEMVSDFLYENYKGEYFDCMMHLFQISLFHCPQKDCIKLSDPQLYHKIPRNKSLLNNPPNKGFAIGNLNSQLNANFYLSPLDEFVLNVLKVKWYIRFVDDILFVIKSDNDANHIFNQIKEYLSDQLLLKLHPKKIYIQHYSKGVLYIGTYVKPGRRYISNRTLSSFYDCIYKYNKIIESRRAEKVLDKFMASINSYLGMMIHCSSYNLRRKCIKMIDARWWKYIYFEKGFKKVIIKKCYRTRNKFRNMVIMRDTTIFRD